MKNIWKKCEMEVSEFAEKIMKDDWFSTFYIVLIRHKYKGDKEYMFDTTMLSWISSDREDYIMLDDLWEGQEDFKVVAYCSGYDIENSMTNFIFQED